LSHSAGITVSGFEGYRRGKQVPSLHQVLNGTKPANSETIRVNVMPGSKYRYSGGGFVVLQQLLLDLVGTDFPHLMKERVLDKVGMTSSTYQQPLPEVRQASAATGHESKGSVLQGKWHVYPEMAPAGLWSTPTDLSRFAIELQDEVMAVAVDPVASRAEGCSWVGTISL